MTNPIIPPQILLDSKAAAAALSISPRTLWTLTKRGDIASVKIGSSVRYRVAALEEFAKAAERGATS